MQTEVNLLPMPDEVELQGLSTEAALETYQYWDDVRRRAQGRQDGIASRQSLFGVPTVSDKKGLIEAALQKLQADCVIGGIGLAMHPNAARAENEETDNRPALERFLKRADVLDELWLHPEMEERHQRIEGLLSQTVRGGEVVGNITEDGVQREIGEILFAIRDKKDWVRKLWNMYKARGAGAIGTVQEQIVGLEIQLGEKREQLEAVRMLKESGRREI